jgi:predicted O-methyltransferase YrrM
VKALAMSALRALAGLMLRRSLAAAALVALLAPAAAVQAQERFSIFVGSDPLNVELMLRLARLRDDDSVIDLGSGDGRIVIGAALANPKLHGVGVDIDPKLVVEADAAAREHGVGERVRFLQQNAFDADLSQVSVIFMWLWPELQLMLRPKILSEAKPGTRVVTNVWDLGSWKPDEIDADGATVSLWVVPAKVAGAWSWELDMRGTRVRYATLLEQRFQQVEGFTRVRNRRAVLQEVRLRGDEIAIACDMTLDGLGYARHLYTGKVNGDAIEGSVRIVLRDPVHRQLEDTFVLPWRARRSPDPGYFAPTGLDAL